MSRSAETRSRRRFAVVRSRFNEGVTERLLAGAIACLRAHGVADDDIDVISVPGAWELPFAASLAAGRGDYAGIVAIGCVIRGDTPHFDYVAGPAADGLARVALDTGVPVAFGVLTTNTAEQAFDRAGGRQGNKGWDAALSALELADLAADFEGKKEPLRMHFHRVHAAPVSRDAAGEGEGSGEMGSPPGAEGGKADRGRRRGGAGSNGEPTRKLGAQA